MIHPRYGIHGVPYPEAVNSQLVRRRESLSRKFSSAGKESLIQGVEADRDGGQRVQEVHRSILADPQEGHLIKPWYRIRPGGEVAQEGL